MRFTLQWPVYQRVEIVEDSPRQTPGEPKTALRAAVGTQKWVRAVGRRPEFKDVFQIDGLYRRLLAQDQAPEEHAKAFVQKYGFLRVGTRQPLEVIYQEIGRLRSVVDAIERHDWRALDRDGLLGKDGSGWRLPVDARFERFAGSTAPVLSFQPRDLLGAVYLQFFQDQANGAKIKLCARPGCSEWFYYGPGTGRRETAEYCSPKCQKAHQYTRAKEC